MDIRILLCANNRNETDFSDEPLFWRKSAQLTVYCRYLFKEIGFAPFYRKIIKRESKSFSWILENFLVQIIVPKQILLMSLYFGENMRNWPSIVHFYLRKLEIAPFYRKITKRESKSFSWILEYSLMPIIDRKQIFLMSLYYGENLPNWPSIVHFYWRQLYICTIISGYHQEVEQIIFMDIRVFLNANNLTETGFADERVVWRKSAQLTVYCRFLLKEIGNCSII